MTDLDTLQDQLNNLIDSFERRYGDNWDRKITPAERERFDYLSADYYDEYEWRLRVSENSHCLP